MTVQLTWNGDQLIELIAGQLTAGLQRFDEHVAAESRAELTPGHGYITGQLKASISADPVRRSFNAIDGGVSASRSYSGIVHARYEYITGPLQRLIGGAAAEICRS